MKGFYKDLKDIGGMSKEVADKYLTSFNAQMDILINKFKVWKISVGGIIAEQLKSLNAIMDKLLSIWTAFDEPMKKFIVYVGEILVVSGPVIVAFGSILKIFTSLSAILISLLSPIGLVITALGYLVLSSKEISKVFKNSFNSLSSMISLISSKIKNWTDTDSKLLVQYVKIFELELIGIKNKIGVFVDFIRNDFGGAQNMIWQGLVAGLELTGKMLLETLIRIRKGLSDSLAQELLFDIVGINVGVSEAQIQELAMRDYKRKLGGASPWKDKITPRGDMEKYPHDFQNLLRDPDLFNQAYEGIRRELENTLIKESRADIWGKAFGGMQTVLNVAVADYKAQMEKIVATTSGWNSSGEGFVNALKDIDTRTDAKIQDVKKEAEILKKKEEALAVKALTAFGEPMKKFIMHVGKILTVGPSQDEMSEVLGSIARVSNWVSETLEKGMHKIKIRMAARAKAEQLMAAKDPYLREQREAIASLYEGLQWNNGAYEAQLKLLNAEKIILESIVGDNAQLPIWYDRQVELLKRKIAIESAFDPMVQDELEATVKIYEGLKDQTGIADVKLKLLENEMAVAKVLVKDNELLTEYYERQAALIRIQEAKTGNSLLGGFTAGIQNMQLELQTLGELGYEVGYSLRNGIVDSLTDAVFEAKNLKDAMNAVFKDIAKQAFRQGITGPITNMMGSAVSAMSGMFSGGRGGTYQGSYTPYISSEPGVTTHPGMASGGMAWNPHVTWVAEKEPEMITPLSKMGEVFGKGTPDVTLNINNGSSANVQANTQDVHWDGKRLIAGIILQDKRNNGLISRGTRGR